MLFWWIFLSTTSYLNVLWWSDPVPTNDQDSIKIHLFTKFRWNISKTEELQTDRWASLGHIISLLIILITELGSLFFIRFINILFPEQTTTPRQRKLENPAIWSTALWDVISSSGLCPSYIAVSTRRKDLWRWFPPGASNSVRRTFSECRKTSTGWPKE